MGKKIDLSDVEGSYEPVPSGTYRAVLDEIEYGENVDREWFRWVFWITDGEYEGRMVSEFTGLGEDELWKFQSFYVTFYPDKDPDDLGEIDFEPSKYEGTELSIVVQKEEYEGEIQNRVQSISLVDEKASTSAEEDDLSTW